ncbi:hypothetical protein BH11PSE11_BH11PSE11_24150 [soil metagenome]
MTDGITDWRIRDCRVDGLTRCRIASRAQVSVDRPRLDASLAEATVQSACQPHHHIELRTSLPTGMGRRAGRLSPQASQIARNVRCLTYPQGVSCQNSKTLDTVLLAAANSVLQLPCVSFDARLFHWRFRQNCSLHSTDANARSNPDFPTIFSTFARIMDQRTI